MSEKSSRRWSETFYIPPYRKSLVLGPRYRGTSGSKANNSRNTFNIMDTSNSMDKGKNSGIKIIFHNY
jgi:hypothetical protein